ncbi:hypothetical protein RZS08_44345, partial [Arthrospira platensis SPKY1]|nr:hypothetical protein [Arthrospira platensis SPKY1]
MGYRGPANYVMGNNLACIEQIRQSELEGLFLPPFAVADQRVMISSPRDWLVGCCIEFLECQRTLSSYFSPDQSLVTKALALAD